MWCCTVSWTSSNSESWRGGANVRETSWNGVIFHPILVTRVAGKCTWEFSTTHMKKGFRHVLKCPMPSFSKADPFPARRNVQTQVPHRICPTLFALCLPFSPVGVVRFEVMLISYGMISSFFWKLAYKNMHKDRWAFWWNPLRPDQRNTKRPNPPYRIIFTKRYSHLRICQAFEQKYLVNNKS